MIFTHGKVEVDGTWNSGSLYYCASVRFSGVAIVSQSTVKAFGGQRRDAVKRAAFLAAIDAAAAIHPGLGNDLMHIKDQVLSEFEGVE